jgi:N-formylglutamate deformylase
LFDPPRSFLDLECGDLSPLLFRGHQSADESAHSISSRPLTQLILTARGEVMYFKNDEVIVDLVRRFESCAIHPADFRHYQHLTVALWYVRQLPYEAASEKMRNGIQKLAAAHGKNAYHETITLFWLKLVSDFVAAHEAGALSDLANQLVEALDDKDLIKKYYSEELIASAEAKSCWVEPDLKSL